MYEHSVSIYKEGNYKIYYTLWFLLITVKWAVSALVHTFICVPLRTCTQLINKGWHLEETYTAREPEHFSSMHVETLILLIHQSLLFYIKSLTC